MQKFIGTKVILAKPMTLGGYNDYRGWTMPSNEDPNKAGFLVEYTDGGPPNDSRHVGYISWSPADAFQAYRPVTGLSFGQALEALKVGHRVCRAGWNGKGMWLSLSGPREGRRIPASSFWSENNMRWAQGQPDDQALVLPCITMKTVDATGREGILMGWLASQTDMLYEDWMVL
jgi:hypothetical protein